MKSQIFESPKTKVAQHDPLSKPKLSIGDRHQEENGIGIFYKGLLEDSRCPPKMQCIWAGNAKLELELILKDSTTIRFELNTNLKFRIDTTIQNTYILLESLSRKGLSSTVANLLVVNLDKLEKNAQIIGFNDESGCNYGYLLERSQDTIVSNDYKLKRLLGDKLNFPIDIYIETSEEKSGCKENEVFKNYHLRSIVMTKN